MKQQQYGPVLFADDDENDTYFFRLAFEAADLPNPLVTFPGGQEVITFLETPRYPSPRLLVLDLKMPRVDGFAVLTWIRSHPQKPGFPVTVLSASQQQTDIQKAYALGAADYCVKPPDYKSITVLLARWKEKWLVEGTSDAHILKVPHSTTDTVSDRKWH
jgi:CheY-like chemotaxis protein